MRIKDYQCKCGSKDFFALKKSESQVGIYCDKCGLWFKWADKNEKNLISKVSEHEKFILSQMINSKDRKDDTI